MNLNQDLEIYFKLTFASDPHKIATNTTCQVCSFCNTKLEFDVKLDAVLEHEVNVKIKWFIVSPPVKKQELPSGA